MNEDCKKWGLVNSNFFIVMVIIVLIIGSSNVMVN